MDNYFLLLAAITSCCFIQVHPAHRPHRQGRALMRTLLIFFSFFFTFVNKFLRGEKVVKMTQFVPCLPASASCCLVVVVDSLPPCWSTWLLCSPMPLAHRSSVLALLAQLVNGCTVVMHVSIYQLPFCASPSIYTPTRHHVELVGGSSEYIGGEHRKKGDSMSTTFRPGITTCLE